MKLGTRDAYAIRCMARRIEAHIFDARGWTDEDWNSLDLAQARSLAFHAVRQMLDAAENLAEKYEEFGKGQ